MAQLRSPNPAPFTLLRRTERPLVDVPLQPYPLVGRDREVARLRGLLSRSDVRLVTLTGPAGVGKTRLAVEVAGRAASALKDGAVFVELAPLADPALVVPTVVHAVTSREGRYDASPGRLVPALQDKHVLLVLDNFEHVLVAAGELPQMLASCPGVKVLVTSRAPLHLRWEHRFLVPPLPLPDLEPLAPVEVLARNPAVALFVQRARAVRPDFALTPANALAVAEICVRLDGLPLGIELAAARSDVLVPEAIRARLAECLGSLGGEPHDLPARHRTLRTAVTWSVDQLGPAEQCLLRRLAVFAGGWTLEAAEAVCTDAGLAPPHVLELTARLVDQSLVMLRGEGRQGRYRMLEAVRTCGLEQLAAGEAEAVRRRHYDWCLALAEQAELKLLGSEQTTWLNRLDEERDNLRAALRWCWSGGEAASGLRLSVAMWVFWYIRGYLDEGRGWLEAFLQAAGPDAPAYYRAKALDGLGGILRVQGDYARARRLMEEGLALRRQLGDALEISRSLNNLAVLTWVQGDLTAARAFNTEGLSLTRALGDLRQEALFVGNLANVAWSEGDRASARALMEACLALRRRVEDKRGLIHTLSRLAALVQEQGEVGTARALLEECLSLQREVGDQPVMSLVLEGFASVASAEGQPAAVARLLGAADALRAKVGIPLAPYLQAAHDRLVAQARTALGDQVFAAAWASGRTMPSEQVVEEVLAAPPSILPTARRVADLRFQAATPALTAREREVAILVAQGLTSREIAARLVVSPRTVETHTEHILRKLDLKTRAQLAAWAVAQGLHSPGTA